jgi:uncharacterized membrane protein|tara:strand:+ start:287 stop:562 length:276 start_codon:yes stop_codon:yes gene_type:complete
MAKENLVNLKPEKISEEHLNEVQSVVSKINELRMEIGRLETNKHALLHSHAGLQDELKLVQDKLEKEYGTCNINIQDGSIKYPENADNKKD